MRRWLQILTTAGATLIIAGCERAPASGSTPNLIVISADTAGWITPCGCASNQSGGLARRGTYLNELRANASVLYFDAGGAAAGNSDYHRTKFEAILDGEMIMKVAAHNLGRAEIALGASYLRRTATQKNVPFVSANVRDLQGHLVAEPVRIIRHGGSRVAIVGVCSPQFATDELLLDDPRRAILAVISQHKANYDALLVLAYLSEDELHELALNLPEVDAVIGGPTGQAVPPRVAGATLLAAATNKGKFLVEVEMRPQSAGQWTARIVEMSASIRDDPAQQTNLQAYLARLAQRDFPADSTALAAALPPDAPDNYRIAGSESCASCHQAEFDSWRQSRHAHAWETLQSKGFHVDSYCQQCHTTGFALPSGFASPLRSPLRANVGCENCHGPSQAHVENVKLPTPFAAFDQCTVCHDHENSPSFDQETYWEKIRHGPTKTGWAR